MRKPEEQYAHQLLESCFGRLSQELSELQGPLEENAEFFCNPEVPVERYEAVLRESLEGRVDSITLDFLLHLARERRLSELPKIIRRFKKVAGEALGRITVELRISHEPDEDLLGKLRAYLADCGLIPRDKAADALFDITVDKSLLGGFMAEYNGRLIDKSLKTRLFELRRYAAAKYPTGKV